MIPTITPCWHPCQHPNFLSVVIPNPSLSLSRASTWPHIINKRTKKPEATGCSPASPVRVSPVRELLPNTSPFRLVAYHAGATTLCPRKVNSSVGRRWGCWRGVFFRSSERPNFVRLSRRRCAVRVAYLAGAASVGLVTWRRWDRRELLFLGFENWVTKNKTILKCWCNLRQKGS